MYKNATFRIIDGPSFEDLFASLRYAYPKRAPRRAVPRVRFRVQPSRSSCCIDSFHCYLICVDVQATVIGLTYKDDSGVNFILDINSDDPLPLPDSGEEFCLSRIDYNTSRRTGFVMDIRPRVTPPDHFSVPPHLRSSTEPCC